MQGDDPVCDRVLIHDDDGTRDLTFDQFLAIPLSMRIRYVIERRAQFFAEGDEVESHVALSRLRKAAAVAG